MKRFVLTACLAVPLALAGTPAARAHEHCGGQHHDCHGCSAMRAAGGQRCPGCSASAQVDASAASPAQPESGVRGGGGWGPGNAYGRLYDAKTVETVRGEVLGIDRFAPDKGMSAGVHLRVKTGAETLSVHVGPEWYLEQQDVEINVHDLVEVKGSRVTFEGQPAIIAAEIHKGDETLTLRDASGFPAWRGWRRR